MAAMLERNGADGKPVADPGLPTTEVVDCAVRACPISYTLASGQVENRIDVETNENVINIMRRKAQVLVTDNHPHPFMADCYVWGGTKLGWLDKEAAKAAGM